MTVYNLKLFEQLNEEYRLMTAENGGRGLFPSSHLVIYDRFSKSNDEHNARKSRLEYMKRVVNRIENDFPSMKQNLDVRGLTERGRLGSKLRDLLRDVDISEKNVVEIGCGHGWVSDGMVRYAGATSVIGLDVRDYPWDVHSHQSLKLIKADLSRDQVLANASADVVVSFVVMEHVSRPIQMLRAIYDVLRPGGVAWLRFNLYRGWNASHRATGSAQVFFPWPHLLFESDICKEYFKKHTGAPHGYSWVNKMTISEYLTASVDAGFEIEFVDLIQSPIDYKFYHRFEDKLGKYPALDLSTPFMKMILRKPDSLPSGYIPSPGYCAAQRELDDNLKSFLADQSSGA